MHEDGCRDVPGDLRLGVAELLALLSALLLASATVVTRFGLQYMPPRAGAAISVPTAAVLIAAGAFQYLDLGGFHPRAASIFLCVGLFFPAFATLLMFESNARIGPSLTGALSSVVPLFAMTGAWLFLGEIPPAAALFGALLVVVGVARLSIPGYGVRPDGLGWLLLLPLAVAAIRGIAQSSLKAAFVHWPDVYAALAATYGVSAIVVRLLYGFTKTSARPARSWTGRGWFMAVGILNATAILAMYAAISRGSVLVVSALVATFPAFVVCLERALFGRRATRPSSFVIGLTVLGVVLTVCGSA